jgi:hypothetical protein
VAPLEFTTRRDAYQRLGGHNTHIRNLDDVLETGGEYGAGVRVIGEDP